jgi:hypothetical protein
LRVSNKRAIEISSEETVCVKIHFDVDLTVVTLMYALMLFSYKNKAPERNILNCELRSVRYLKVCQEISHRL